MRKSTYRPDVYIKFDEICTDCGTAMSISAAHCGVCGTERPVRWCVQRVQKENTHVIAYNR